MGKQVYKQELAKKYKIYYVFMYYYCNKITQRRDKL